MKSNELLEDVFKKHEAKDLTGSQKLALITLNKWVHPDGEMSVGTLNALERVALLIDETGDERIPQWICDRANGVFVHHSLVSGDVLADLLPAEQQTVNGFKELLLAISKPMKNLNISPDESQNIRQRWEELKTAMDHFVVCCEKEDYAGYHVHISGMPENLNSPPPFPDEMKNQPRTKM